MKRITKFTRTARGIKRAEQLEALWSRFQALRAQDKKVEVICRFFGGIKYYLETESLTASTMLEMLTTAVERSEGVPPPSFEDIIKTLRREAA